MPIESQVDPVDAALRDVYATSASRRQFTLKIRRLMAETGISRAMLGYRAKKLGLRFISNRNWTRDEDVFIEENAGELPVRTIAKMLGRSVDSIYMRMFRLRLKSRCRRGYGICDLSDCLGCSDSTIHIWIKRGWLRRRDGRFPASMVNRFLADHLDEISLKRAEEEWLKDRLVELFNERRK